MPVGSEMQKNKNTNTPGSEPPSHAKLTQGNQVSREEIFLTDEENHSEMDCTSTRNGPTVYSLNQIFLVVSLDSDHKGLTDVLGGIHIYSL